MEAVETQFSFMASGPLFQLSLPDEFEELPELTSPVANGAGGRDFQFFPAIHDHGLEGCVRLDDLVDRDGRSVEFYSREDTPPLWWLRWELKRGAVYTHLREEDGVEMGPVTTKAVSVMEAKNGLPFLFLDSPLLFDINNPRTSFEEAMYFSHDTGTFVVLTRPSFLEAGRVLQAPTEATVQTVVRAGLGENVEALVTSPRANEQSALDTVDLLVSSFETI